MSEHDNTTEPKPFRPAEGRPHIAAMQARNAAQAASDADLREWLRGAWA